MPHFLAILLMTSAPSFAAGLPAFGLRAAFPIEAAAPEVPVIHPADTVSVAGAFVKSMTEPSADLVSPLQVRRVAGRFTLRGAGGQVVVSFIGSTHEWTTQNGKSAATQEELDFIFRHFPGPQCCANRVLLVEQGSSAAGNRLAGFVRSIAGGEKNLLAYLDYKEKTANLRTELPAACVRARQAGGESVNMDLLYGEEILEFYLEHFDAGTALKALCHAFNTLEFSVEQARWITGRMIQARGLEKRLDIAAAQAAVGDYYGRLLYADPLEQSDLRRALAPDSLRNRYMAGEILSRGGDVLILAHTAHIVGVVNALKAGISDFELLSSELSAPNLGRFMNFPPAVRKEINDGYRAGIEGSVSPLTVR